MKRILCFFALLWALSAQAQDSVMLKMGLLPGRSYESIMGLNIACKINLSGDQQVLDKLSQQGITQPLNLNINVKMVYDSKTGNADAENNFPVKMSYHFEEMAITLNGKQVPVPTKQLTGKNIIIYGHATSGGMLQADSLAGMPNDTAKERMNRMMNSFMHHIQFPEHAMHIGDTFTQRMPLNIPLGNSGANMSANVVYKLISITGEQAGFDISQNMDMDIPVKGQHLKLSGNGTGKMVYSIKHSYPLNYNATLQLKFSGLVGTLQVDGTADMTMDYKNAISVNPQ